MSDLIDRQAAIKAICEDGTWLESQGCTEITMAERKQRDADILSDLPSAQPEIIACGQGELVQDGSRLVQDLISRQAAIDALWKAEVKCLSCGHHIAERPLEVYCNIMCKWVNEKDYCTMFEPGAVERRE